MPMRSGLSSKATRFGLAISTWTAPTRQQKINSWLIFVGDQSIAPVVGWLKAIKIREVWNRRLKSLKPAWISCRRLEWKCLSPKIPRWGAKCPLLWAKHGGRLKKVRGHNSIRHSNWLGFPIQVGSIYDGFPEIRLVHFNQRNPWSWGRGPTITIQSEKGSRFPWPRYDEQLNVCFIFWFELQLKVLFEKGYFANCNFQNWQLEKCRERPGCAKVILATGVLATPKLLTLSGIAEPKAISVGPFNSGLS